MRVLITMFLVAGLATWMVGCDDMSEGIGPEEGIPPAEPGDMPGQPLMDDPPTLPDDSPDFRNEPPGQPFPDQPQGGFPDQPQSDFPQGGFPQGGSPDPPGGSPDQSYFD